MKERSEESAGDSHMPAETQIFSIMDDYTRHNIF